MSTRLLLEYSVGVLAIVCGALGALFMCTMALLCSVTCGPYLSRCCGRVLKDHATGTKVPCLCLK